MKKMIIATLAMALMLSCTVGMFAAALGTSETDEVPVSDEAPTTAEAPLTAGNMAVGYVFLSGEPSGVLPLADGSLLVADTYYKIVWRIADGVPEIYAGRLGVVGLNGEPIGGYNDAEFDNAAFMSPWGLAPFLDGYAVTDTENHVVRFIDPGREIVRTAVGTGKPGYADLRGTNAAFNRPTGITADSSGNIYVADTGNHVIRRVNTNGNVTTYAGSKEGCLNGSRGEAAFREPTGVFWQSGALYVADSGNHRVCKIEDGVVSTVCGGSEAKTGDAFYEGGYVDGEIGAAMFSNPQGIVVAPDGKIYVADTGNGSVRVIDIENGRVRTISRSSSDKMYPVSPRSLTMQDSRLYIGDVFARTLYSLPTGGKSFTDVNPEDWFYEAVVFASLNGLFEGVSDTELAPYGTMTRGMFATVIGRVCRILRPGSVIRGDSAFNDVQPGQYYSNSVAWAADNGIVSGTSADTFSPNANITREEMASLLYNFAELMQLDTSVGDGERLSAFPDSDRAASWAVDALAWASAHGIINGSDEGLLTPEATATRAQAAQIFLNFFQRLDL